MTSSMVVVVDGGVEEWFCDCNINILITVMVMMMVGDDDDGM